ncbi:MAG: hypothetical protein A3I68_03460 [Candidatus Melainabacteria bacterium RIFCSPLOWO2_02_FULL_35_15]|nr:MAG: hypothetical protein A3F80_03780 [Candidatus Melainabacteria bacterium RIFCSPLOWO2_12_FULL_35_11]OGI14660.1 MAG: hypothetical protein A3I68_03460 [Candidatus Melainabacteria bacterium RIFCSPLOWO2_02_FULL_35_15]
MRNERGFAVVFFALLLVAILGLGSLVLDLGQSYSIRARIKNAVDFSSIAGVSQLISSTDVDSAKNIALQYLNDNLSMLLPSFNTLTLNNSDVSVQLGIYNFSTMTFTEDEANPSVNAIKVSYTYRTVPFLATVFMIDNIQISESATAAKQIAGNMAPGGGFPLALDSSLLSVARNNNYMVDLVQTGLVNSYFTSFNSNSASADDIKAVIDYFQNQSTGTSPPALMVGDDFQINNGTLAAVYMTLDSTYFEGKTFVAPVITPDQNFASMVTVQAFVGLTIDDVYKVGNDYHISATLIPKYIDNMWSGLTVGAGPGNISTQDQSVLATSFGLVI